MVLHLLLDNFFLQKFDTLYPNTMVFPYIDMNRPRVHVFPHFEPPSYLPTHPIPLGCPRAPTLSALLRALNLHWSSILHMVTYTFQCYPVKSYHPYLLPHSPKVCSLHLCLFCYLAYRLIATVILYSINMC